MTGLPDPKGVFLNSVEDIINYFDSYGTDKVEVVEFHDSANDRFFSCCSHRCIFSDNKMTALNEKKVTLHSYISI